MHQNIKVAEIGIDEETVAISRIGDVYAPEHIPIGISFKNNRPNRGDLNDWWHGRSIPASRQNIRDAIDILGVSSTEKLLSKGFGLSLSDQYWINPINNLLDWGKINFFDNAFSDDVGDALFGNRPRGMELNLISPDNTSDGWLKKKWKIMDGKRCLIKGGSNPFQQEPFNEALASAVMRRLNIDHVPYTILWDDGLPYSVCEDFIMRDTEFINAYYIHNTRRIENIAFLYKHYLLCCADLGITNARENLDKMLVLDFLIANRDRHLSNFGAVRHADTLEWLGVAPIFDSGTSLWNDRLPDGFDMEGVKSKPFLDTHDEQIRMIEDFSWLDTSQLNGIDEEFHETLSTLSYLDRARRDALCIALNKRVAMLNKIVQR